jgi:hypothetical protein
MIRPSGAAAIASALGLVGLLVLGARAIRPRTAPGRGPLLSIAQRDPGATPGRSIAAPATIALALGGLPPGELPRMREHLAEAADVAARLAAPDLFDLGELADDAGTGTQRELLPDLPALTAAANLRGAPWEAPGIAVRLGAECEPAAARCVPLFSQSEDDDSGDALVRRGRSLAWALAKAGLLRVAAGSRPALLRSLRASQPRPSGAIALVFDAPRGKLDEAELDRLRQEARRALADLREGAPERPWLEALAAAPPDWELPIGLDADEVLVVPRLRVLARLQDFTSEVESAGTIEWVVRPRP